MECARLTRYGLLSVTGADAREFLHAQLTNDIRSLSPDRAALAGWCSAKGRLLATFLVIPAPKASCCSSRATSPRPMAKRLSMFVLRSKVKIADESDAWAQIGRVGRRIETSRRGMERSTSVRCRVGEKRFLRLEPAQPRRRSARATRRPGRCRRSAPAGRSSPRATQDQFVPQMVNLETARRRRLPERLLSRPGNRRARAVPRRR